MALRSFPLWSTTLLRWLLFQRRLFTSSINTGQQGLTLIECLVAIVVIAITVTTITPPIFLATATRIQSRRGEQANQIAQAEVDRIRQMVETGVYTVDQLPIDTGAGNASDVAAASGVNSSLLVSPATCGTYPPIPATAPVSDRTLIPVDIDGDCRPEFAMQVYRSAPCTPASLPSGSPPYAFQIGVRVYTYNPGEAMNNLRTDRSSLGLTTASKDTGSVRRPMQTLYSRVARVNTNESLVCSGSGTGSSPSPSPTP